MSLSAKRILCAWFPNWPIQRLVVDRPELRRQQVTLFRRDSRRGQLVTAASPLAMQAGVCTDMPLSEAKSLLRRTGRTNNAFDQAFHILEHAPDIDQATLENLADELEAFSPIVGLQALEEAQKKQGQRVEAIFLDVTGLAHLFDGEDQLANRLLQHLEQQGYLPRIAVASTVGSAWAFARFCAGQHFQQHQHPLCLAPADEAERLEQLPILALRLDSATTDTLYQLGIRTLSQLKRLPRNDLAMRFGDCIHRRLDQLTGDLEEPVVARHKPSEFIAEQLLEFPTHHRETLEVMIQRLVIDLCQQLSSRQQGALEWHIRLNCQTGPPITFQVNLFQPTATVDHVMPLVAMQLEQALSPVTRKVKKRQRSKQVNTQAAPSNSAQAPATSSFPSDPQFHRYTTVEITEVQVIVHSHVLLVQQQRKLFDENPQLDRQALSHLISRLASRMGARSIVYPTLQSGAQPEYSFRFKPLVDSRRRTRRQVTRGKSQSHLLARPARLLRRPLPLKTLQVCQDHTSAESCLEIISLQSPDDNQHLVESFTDQRVVARSGPERIETGWWRGRTVCRDYWRVATETGQHYWIYCDRRTKRWWLHGVF